MTLKDYTHACKNGAGVAVGSRYVKGGAVENWPANRIAFQKELLCIQGLLPGCR